MAKTKEKVDSTCVACGTVCRKNKKPEPKDNREKKQVDFRCFACGAKNLRDGTAIYDRKLPPEEGAPTPKDRAKAPQADAPGSPSLKEPERSIEDEENDDDSLTVL